MKKKAKKVVIIIIIAIVSTVIVAVAAFLVWNKWQIDYRGYGDIRVAEVKGNALLIRDGEYINLYDNFPLMENDEIILYQGRLSLQWTRAWFCAWRTELT